MEDTMTPEQDDQFIKLLASIAESLKRLADLKDKEMARG
jgi:hypothetical protein